MANSAFSQNATLAPGTQMGQCRFDYTSTSVCTLTRYDGRYLFINGVYETIPAAGVTLSNSGLAANDTTYYVYAYMSAGVMTLEASATAPAADGTHGHQIKTGDATRTLVGMVRKTSGNFVYTAAIKLVLSYFNRKVRTCWYQASSAGFTSTTPASFDSSTGHGHFLTWADEHATCVAQLSAYQTAGSPAYFGTFIYLDGSAAGSSTYAAPIDSGNSVNAVGSITYSATLSAGYHYFTAYAVVNTGTITFQAGSGLMVTLKG